MDNKYEVVKFIDNQFELDVRADKENKTVWLKPEEKAKLFGDNRPAIVKHIFNIIKDNELDNQHVPFWNKFKLKVIVKFHC